MFLPMLKLLEYLCYVVVFIVLLKFSDANPIKENTIATPLTVEEDIIQNKRDFMKRALENCETGFSWMCLKMEFVKLMERLAEQEELNIMPGISIVKDMNAIEVKSSEMMAEVARNYPNDPSIRLNGYIISKFSNFLQTHFLRFKLIDSNTVTEARSLVETGRKGKFGKKGGLEGIIAAGLMMKGTLLALGMGAIALMAGKALMTALMALTLSGVLGLKSLANGGGKSTTYEIVAKPVYTSSHSHSLGGGESGHYGGGGGSGGSGFASGYRRSLQFDVPEQIHKPNFKSN